MAMHSGDSAEAGLHGAQGGSMEALGTLCVILWDQGYGWSGRPTPVLGDHGGSMYWE